MPFTHSIACHWKAANKIDIRPPSGFCILWAEKNRTKSVPMGFSHSPFMMRKKCHFSETSTLFDTLLKSVISLSLCAVRSWLLNKLKYSDTWLSFRIAATKRIYAGRFQMPFTHVFNFNFTHPSHATAHSNIYLIHCGKCTVYVVPKYFWFACLFVTYASIIFDNTVIDTLHDGSVRHINK